MFQIIYYDEKIFETFIKLLCFLKHIDKYL